MPSALSAPPGATLATDQAPLDQGRLHEIQAQLRDIHPGPELASVADPRLLAWGWLLIMMLILFLIITLALTLWRQRRWVRQIDWQGEDLVPRLQATLRQAALARWPEARTLQGEDWLSWLDKKGGSHFADLAEHWSDWLYDQQQPDARQRALLRRAYLRWGRRCVSSPRILPRGQVRRASGPGRRGAS
ncbi:MULTISPECIES: DUF4381 family protein [Aeromonas]|uniref:DUF4381 family protein n=1 Tax=Aeromonas TaxID=642 RepID=UPI001F4A2DF1|nr:MULTISPECIES: DUF4381 family protein [Aeromonas]MCH7370007.1 DUF4381 domain-containing protein [Aeromonas sp. MR16]